jgi:hypothetical protein
VYFTIYQGGTLIGFRIYQDIFEIGKTIFPVNRSISIATDLNVIKAELSYGDHSLPCAINSKIVDGKIKITCDIK